MLPERLNENYLIRSKGILKLDLIIDVDSLVKSTIDEN